MKWLLCAMVCLSGGVARASEPITRYEVLFSPHNAVAEELMSMIDKERKSLKIAVHALEHRGIFKALFHAQERGVDIEVIVDRSSVKGQSPFRKLKSFPFHVFVWNPPLEVKELASGKKIKKKRPIMDNKFCIFGEDRVWIGSLDFTAAATHLHQGSGIVLESREIATRYLEEFERLKGGSCMPLSAYVLTL